MKHVDPAVQLILSFLLLLFLSHPAQAKIQCYDCHGSRNPVDYRPVDSLFRNASTGGFPGNHRTHLAAPSSPAACVACHPGSESYGTDHRDGLIQLGANLNSSPVPARYRNVTSAFPQVINPTLGTCTNVNCHFERTTPVWGALPFSTAGDCSGCHDSPPNDGTHVRHDDYYGPGSASCGRCHADHAASPAPFAHATSAGKRGLHLKGFQYAKVENTAYPNYLPSRTPASERNGTCSNISCHGNTSAVWGGAASALCLDCHSVSQGNRAAITPQFGASSHHVQGTITNAHCYQCHWEANSDGSINGTYHHSRTPGGPVDLVIYGAGTRPGTYSTGITAIQYTANGNRTEIDKISSHCLGCHSDRNNTATPFGDGKTPRQYAWDGTSVAARYGQTGTTTWGKYSSVTNAAQKRTAKALSAHGNAAANKRGWNTATGVDGAISNTSGGVNVQCFDCHNSHGSTVSGTTTRYASATASGGILKDTTISPNGYSVAYKPYSGGSAAGKNKRNAGASLCLDCHLNESPVTTPWGYSATFGASQGILGFWDVPGYGAYSTSGTEKRFPYKKLNPMTGGHFGASAPLSDNPSSGIGGLCTPCHDPHGVSPTLGTNQQYAVPLLKGTWLTSPYKEDAAPQNNSVGTTYRANSGTEAAAYRIDQNTFSSGGITQSISQSAGLCIGCHSQASLTDGVTHTWRSKDRIHESVAGWKTAPGTRQHGFSCSKCHSPHTNAALPRLMVTNCLDGRHKGRLGLNSSAAISGSGWGDYDGCYDSAAETGACWAAGQWSGSGQGRIPGNYAGSGAYSNIACHEAQNGSASGTDQRWNDVTPWTNATPVITSGPSSTAGGLKVLMRMDEAAWNGTAGEVRDTSGSNNHGTASAATTVAGGVTGRAGSFNGSSSRVTVQFASGSVPVDNFTFEAWVKPTATHEVESEATGGTGGTYAQKYLFWPDQMGPSNGGAGLSVGTNGISVYEHGDNYMPALAVYSGAISSSQWTHIAVVYTNKRPSIYVNGVLVRTGLQSLRAHVYAPRIIGGEVYGYFAGQVDDVAIYDRAVTAAEIQLHSQQQCLDAAATSQATISWATDYSYSTSYVDYGTTAAYGMTAGNGTLVTAHSVALPNLINGTTYHYRVRSTEAGGKEVTSGDHTFTMKTCVVTPAAPAGPVLTPQANSTSSGGAIAKTFQWSAVTAPDGDPVQYLVELSSSSTFASIAYSSTWQTGTSWTQSLPIGSWYWRVTARDSGHPTAVSAPSASNAFSIAYSAPTAPVLTAQPTSYVIGSGASANLTFQWSTITVADGDPIQYQVQMSTSSAFSSVAYQSSWQSGVTWSQAVPAGTWYWRITARDALHTSAAATSAASGFSVKDRTPAAPTLVDQPNNSAGGTITFSWNVVASPDGDIVQYQVDVSSSSVFSSIAYQSMWGTGTAWSQAIPAGTWYWRVRARDSVHTTAVSANSASDSFTITPITSQSWTAPGTHAWNVPAGVSSVTVTVKGGGGGGGMTDNIYNQHAGANGNLVTRTISVAPGEQLTLYVASGGRTNGYDNLSGGAGGTGYRGGGHGLSGEGTVGGEYSYGGGGGGGSSAATRGTTVLVEAAGGTGGRSSDYYSENDDYEYIGGAGGAGGGADFPSTTTAGGGGAGGGFETDGGSGSIAVFW